MSSAGVGAIIDALRVACPDCGETVKVRRVVDGFFTRRHVRAPRGMERLGVYCVGGAVSTEEVVRQSSERLSLANEFLVKGAERRAEAYRQLNKQLEEIELKEAAKVSEAEMLERAIKLLGGTVKR